ncbi:MAG: lamin tail domain-containing protein [Flavobacteriales bacterium]|nr:lamin tail domain-containing protein [Flavobacteriales bacterium]
MRQDLLALSMLFCSSISAQVVINEVDYDQPSTDNAEYLEIKNVGSTPYALSGIAIMMFNGSSGSPVEYRNFSNPEWPDLAPGDYFVLCGNLSLVVNCDFEVSPATNLIQNGPTDAIALVDLGSMEVLDALSYGGSLDGYTEGTGSTETDSNTEGLLALSRWPDGADTDDNDTDFTVSCPTPGAINDIELSNCGINTGIKDTPTAPSMLIIPAPGMDRLMVYVEGPSGTVDYQVFTADGALVAGQTGLLADRSTWSFSTVDLHGRLLLVKATTANGSTTRKVMLP